MLPPIVALFLTIWLLVYALRRFRRYSPGRSALWVPIIWIFFIGSRHPAQWLDVFGFPSFLGARLEEGSPVDAAFFTLLIIAGCRILARRQVSLSAIAGANTWIVIFTIYCLLAVGWSDFPFVAFKRWIKTLGHPVMALVILSDPRPLEAIRFVFKRCGLLMLVLSVLFIKYFPQYSRTYNYWGGQSEYCGINNTKNELGYCCLIFGLFFLWNLIVSWNEEDLKARKEEQIVSIALLLTSFWLLKMAQSSTSVVSLVLGSAVLLGLGTSFAPKRHFGAFVIMLIAFVGIAELTIGVYQPILELLGKSATLSDRTLVWNDVISMVETPLIGAGFESFWLGERLDALWAKWWWRPNQAHNGYIETYLNLGLIGLALLLAMLLSTFRAITATFATDMLLARFRMALLFVVVFYNFTEATFKAVHLIWTVFCVIALRVPKPRYVELPQLPGNESGDRSDQIREPSASAFS